MQKFNSREEAFASQNYNPEAVVISGVPDHIIDAAKGFINLCVGHDAVNPEFNPDFTDYDQDKFENWFEVGSPSGGGFACPGCACWDSSSAVGSRLVAESREASKYIGTHPEFQELFKKFMVYDRELKK